MSSVHCFKVKYVGDKVRLRRWKDSEENRWRKGKEGETLQAYNVREKKKMKNALCFRGELSVEEWKE